MSRPVPLPSVAAPVRPAVAAISRARGRGRVRARWLAAAAVLGLAAPLLARTITLTDETADRMAAIAAEAPRLSWAGYDLGGVYQTSNIDINRTHSFLIRYALDQIPKGQRITKAELIVPVNYLTPAEARLYLWRLTAEWGAGVCYQYRTAQGQKVEWKTPGAQGAGTDRATRPSGVERLTKAGDAVFNVTEDVEMWYKGGAANNGWVLTAEDEGAFFRCDSPVYSGRGRWRLRITYEPEG